MTDEQQSAIVELLWDYLKKDPEHKDRRQTGWGTKTKMGLCACINRIVTELDNLPITNVIGPKGERRYSKETGLRHRLGRRRKDMPKEGGN